MLFNQQYLYFSLTFISWFTHVLAPGTNNIIHPSAVDIKQQYYFLLMSLFLIGRITLDEFMTGLMNAREVFEQAKNADIREEVWYFEFTKQITGQMFMRSYLQTQLRFLSKCFDLRNECCYTMIWYASLFEYGIQFTCIQPGILIIL